MNDLDQIFRDCIHIPDAFFGDPNLPDFAARKSAVIRGARSDLDVLMHKVRALLTAPRTASASERNAAIKKIHDTAHRLRSALVDGSAAVSHVLGIVEGRAIDIGGEEWRQREWLQKFSRDLDKLIDMSEFNEPTKGGRPENKQRVVALARIAAFFETWTGHAPSTAEGSHFSQLAAGIFQHLGFADSNDMGGQIAKIVALRASGANLETFAG